MTQEPLFQSKTKVEHILYGLGIMIVSLGIPVFFWRFNFWVWLLSCLVVPIGLLFSLIFFGSSTPTVCTLCGHRATTSQIVFAPHQIPQVESAIQRMDAATLKRLGKEAFPEVISEDRRSWMDYDHCCNCRHIVHIYAGTSFSVNLKGKGVSEMLKALEDLSLLKMGLPWESD